MKTFRKSQAILVRQPEAKKATAPAPARDPIPPHEKIAERAYQIWQASGCAEGRQEEHWYQAERELRAP
jgi:hypothetical protein